LLRHRLLDGLVLRGEAGHVVGELVVAAGLRKGDQTGVRLGNG
jgi:hypothetical protein